MSFPFFGVSMVLPIDVPGRQVGDVTPFGVVAAVSFFARTMLVQTTGVTKVRVTEDTVLGEELPYGIALESGKVGDKVRVMLRAPLPDTGQADAVEDSVPWQASRAQRKMRVGEE